MTAAHICLGIGGFCTILIWIGGSCRFGTFFLRCRSRLNGGAIRIRDTARMAGRCIGLILVTYGRNGGFVGTKRFVERVFNLSTDVDGGGEVQ